MEKRVILVSHGKLSAGMAHSVQMICGENEELSYYSMMPGEHYSTIVDSIRSQAEAHPEIQYIVIADLLGGSVCNGCSELVSMENVKLVSGMNMGLVIELLLEEAPVTDEVIEEKLRENREIVRSVTMEYLNSRNSEDEDFF